MNDTTPRSATLAGLGLRLLAAIYDLLPLCGLWFLAGVVALLATGGALDTHRLAHKLLVQALVLGVTAAYFLVSWLRGGQTIGMRAWRLRVVRADGSPLHARDAVLRLVVAPVSLAALGLGFCWVFFDAERRAWHDLAAGTRVVRLEKS
ncbi:MAG TPA: RDD family protein [Rudaea sp.]|nr:RDD family protein [Rudaea sp.]